MRREAEEIPTVEGIIEPLEKGTCLMHGEEGGGFSI